jgi:general secretion pathway protein H
MTENREDRLRGGTASPLEHPPRHSQVSQQRTSAVDALRGQAFGFTLLEILVVLVLIAVLTSVISLSTARDPRQSLTEQAQRLGLLLTLASDEARIRQQPISWEGDLKGYRFLSEAGGERRLLGDDDLLHERAWQRPLTRLAISREGQLQQALLSPDAATLRLSIGREWVQPRWRIEMADGVVDVAVEFDENGIGGVANR